MEKPFTIGILREITDQYESGDISYGKMVEMLNEIAIKWHDGVSKYDPMTDGKPYPFASGPIDNGYKLPINPTISKMETTQTAVEWLIDTIGYKNESNRIIISIHPDCDITDLILRAKQMEKEQMTIKLPTDDEVEEGLFHQSNEYAIGYKDAIEFVKQRNIWKQQSNLI